MKKSNYYPYPYYIFTFRNKAHVVAFYTAFIYHFSFMKYELWQEKKPYKKHELHISFPSGLSFERLEQLKRIEFECKTPIFIH